MPWRILEGLFSRSKESSRGPESPKEVVRVDTVDGRTINTDRQMLVPLPSRSQGYKILTGAEREVRHLQMVNVVYSTTAAMKAVWEAGRAEAALIQPEPGSGVVRYDLRATLREAKGREPRVLELFLCEIREGKGDGAKPPL